jgi:hypothetical protein
MGAAFLGVRRTIRPLQKIDDRAWRWHVGLDAKLAGCSTTCMKAMKSMMRG